MSQITVDGVNLNFKDSAFTGDQWEQVASFVLNGSGEAVDKNAEDAIKAAAESAASAMLSKSYAVGGTGTRDGEDTDNAKYYSERVAEALKNFEGTGADGVSPIITVTEITGGHRLTITDVNGTKTVDIMDGEAGTDGVSPTINVAEITGGHRLTITDANGTQTVDVMDGKDGADGTGTGGTGADGADGVSPTITVEEITGGHRVTITDVNGTQSFDVMDGEDGADGTGGTAAAADWNTLANKPTTTERLVYYEKTDDFVPIETVGTVSDSDIYYYKVSETPLTEEEMLGCIVEKYDEGTVSSVSVTESELSVSDDRIAVHGVISVPTSYTIGSTTLGAGLWVAFLGDLVYVNKFYKVISETLNKDVLPDILPAVTEADDGKILQVVGGVWSAVTITDGNNVAY